MPSSRLPSRGVIATFSETAGWLARNPILIALFFALGVVDAFGQEIFALSLLGFLLGVFLNGVAHVFAWMEARGDTPRVGTAAEHVTDQYLSLVGVSLVYLAAVLLGLLLLVLPGIYLALRLSLAFPACVIDDLNASGSLRRSWDVAAGDLLKLLGITLVAFAIPSLMAVLLAVDSGLDLGVFAASVVITAIVAPLVQLAYARVYLENRIEQDVVGA